MDELSETQVMQNETATAVLPLLNGESQSFNLQKHLKYLTKMLDPLPSPFTVLDASRAWMVYWELSSLAILGKLDSSVCERAISSVRQLKGPSGGFCGGNGQDEHLLSTYASILSICLCDSTDAYSLIERDRLYDWLFSLKNPDGSFRVNNEGESDARSVYAAVCVSSLVGISMDDPLFEGTLQWLCKCQTYEGGLSGVPYAEAHGGYTFCALAAIALLGGLDNLNEIKLSTWLVQRQDPALYGFSGRSNKLVDGCYSWWVGASHVIVASGYGSASHKSLPNLFYNPEKLLGYILQCCQSTSGGLRDKPPKRPDQYHTCYCLLGLSSIAYDYRYHTSDGWSYKPSILHSSLSSLLPAHPIYCVPFGFEERIKSYFLSQESSKF
ncbi:Protein farnesyltransferase subunit beta [Schizosaccharomyces pombe]|uniref:Protein farnesyltransferase subunit beta n=1 Tax=Schizosaccharomyces pombe (strain 972 / ATCC 24843) TaxID=284812 RepID=FNTB_SCHPO|nr:protein farnesyltransferase beta subunit Cpp1 [Schizosaccharomyces pombe]O13782.1 RecName: Full=Protein farnesyltransferase subunit beta; Short=FTase-beta; AltName: Full=CAAX farnesyltransferase subunit beta; AltName: Full=Ras proteins prenyltransferase subunit beta [Schizosaccharomyces pombe 972h-]CAB16215.1 protein farnesyltransferase beta subunit Cpp1 [Schizosaccharomyces pombe]|eukprot:NP_594251.1 protein farnesyltransferase beta subunit Cpp1 [Schizosaccharomyces pombe]